MAYTFPLAVAVLSDILPIESVVWDSQRSDELSGSGDARTWQASLADPLWAAEVALSPDRNRNVKEIAAIIRKLQGAKNSFFLVDPRSRFPKSDPTGSILGSSSVVIDAIASDRQAISLGGLPANFALTRGDKGQVNYSSNPSRTWFFEVSETVTANSGGEATFEVYPTVPLLVAVNATVILKKPACKGFIMPGTFKPGVADTLITRGVGFTFMERR